MSYCPECGSEVATNDPFCAYCGIALQVMEEIPVAGSLEPDNSPRMGEPEQIQTSAILNKMPTKSDQNDATDQINAIGHELPTSPKFEPESELEGERPIEIESNEEAKSSSETESAGETPVIETTDEELPVGIELSEETDLIETLEETPNVPIPGSDTESDESSDTVSSGDSEIENQTDEIVPGPPLFVENVDEFSQTIPYSPADYSKQDLVAPQANIVGPEPHELDDDQKLLLKLEEISLPPIESAETPSLPEVLSEPTFTQEVDLHENETETGDQAEDVQLSKIEEPELADSVQKEETANIEDVRELDVQIQAQEEPELLGFKPPIVAETPEVASSEELISVGEADDSPIVEEMTKPEVPEPDPAVPEQDLKPVEGAEDKEARAFTNPNIGYGDTDGRNKQKLKPLDEGTVLNARYEVIRKIGGGGMGAVYLANDKNLGGVLRAVKEMVQSYIEEEAQEKAVNDFKRESLLLTSLEHPGIPTIYDYFFDEKEGRFYLVMKYISGGDLSARLRAAPEGRIDEISVTDWAIQIADVLDYLHNRQPPIVYRDLKPSNIMIDGNSGKVMIIDFGIARWVNKEEKGVTAVGTMGYAPPELFSGNVEPRSDIYSLGSTMFHLMTGADPQSNPLLIFDFNKNPRPRQINPNLSDQMEQILMKSVEYNSEQRFSSAAEMRDELQNHLENLKKGTVTFGVISNVVTGQSLSSVPVFCGFCGQKIVASDVFCPFCGAQQPQAGQSQQLKPSQSLTPPKATAKLLIVGTNELEQNEYSLEKENNLLGRRDPMSNIFPEVDMSKYDPQTKISRKHARIWREGNVFMLEDLGSSNGTILINHNNDPIRLLPRQPHVLSNGDKLKLGDTTLRFTIG